MGARRRYALTIAVFAVVLFAALAICASGMISLIADREVLTEGDAGPLVAPIMFAVSSVVLFGRLATQGIRLSSRRLPVLFAAVTDGILVYFVFAISGAVLYAIAHGQLLLIVLFFGSNGFGPFAIAVGIIGLAVSLAYHLLVTYHENGGVPGTPKWWWEKRDDRDRNAPG